MASFCMVVFGESFAFSSVTTGDVRVQTSELEICILVYLFLRNFHNFGNSRFVLFRGYCGASRSRGGASHSLSMHASSGPSSSPTGGKSTRLTTKII